MTVRPPFHLALPVDDLERGRGFYEGVLGCQAGRRGERWIDLDFFGHQLSLHLTGCGSAAEATNPVDGESVLVPHFGVVLPREQWQAIVDRLRGAKIQFLVGPTVRFPGEAGEQATAFVRDPAGNVLEFKSIALERLFAH